MVGWPSEVQHREIGDPRHRGQHRLDLVGGLFAESQIVAEQLDRVLAFDAGGGLFDVVLDVLREIEFDAGEFGLQRGARVVGQILLVTSRRARLSNGFSGTKNSALKKPVASVPSSGRPCCETTVIDLRDSSRSLAHPVDVAVRPPRARSTAARWRGSTDCLPRACGRNSRPSAGTISAARPNSSTGAGQRHDAVGQREVAAPARRRRRRPRTSRVSAFPDDLRQQQRTQRRRDREGGDQAAGDGIGIGLRHRAEDVAFDAGQREQRHEARR